MTASYAKAATEIDRLEASVNSGIILHSDIEQFRRTFKLRSQLDPLFQGSTIAARGEKATTNEIIDFLIDEKLITQLFPITDSEVEQDINQVQVNNKMDRTTLKSAIASQGFTFDDYFELMRVGSSKRALIEKEIRSKVTISEDDVKNHFFNTYTKNTAIPVSYALRLISVDPKNYKSPAAAKDTAARALKEIEGGESFEEVAKRVSDHPSAASGGDLGTVSEDQISPAIREQLKSLQIGKVSPVFGGEKSSPFFIVKLADIKSVDDERLDKIKADIRQQLLASEYQHQISLWIERQRQTAFIHRAGEAPTAGLPVLAHP